MVGGRNGGDGVSRVLGVGLTAQTSSANCIRLSGAISAALCGEKSALSQKFYNTQNNVSDYKPIKI